MKKTTSSNLVFFFGTLPAIMVFGACAIVLSPAIILMFIISFMARGKNEHIQLAG